MNSSSKNMLYLAAQKLWRFLVPLKLRVIAHRVRYALSDAPMILAPTFASDGLISQHITGFLEDPRFMAAYALGKETGAIKGHPGDVQIRAYVCCWAAKHALALPGDFVECGVGGDIFANTDRLCGF